MEIIRTPLDLEETSYQLKNIDEMNHLLFFDIETTGFSAKTSNLYLIGLLSFEENKPIITQLFANTSEDEKDVLEEFIRICKNYKTLIHFNGNTFDIPYIKEKCKQHQLSHPFDVLNGVDIYQLHFKHLPFCLRAFCPYGYLHTVLPQSGHVQVV